MEKYVYIKSSILNKFIDFTEPLKDNEYNIGETWEDYINNKWILLSDEQVKFLEQNPSAFPDEVWNMQLYQKPERTLRQAKFEKIKELEEYDNSSNVNTFYINDVPMWLSVDERQQIATQISANEAVGRETMSRWYNGIEFIFPLNSWEQMLIALEVYAGDANNVTEAHKAAINALETINDVDNYNYKVNYPNKLHF